MDKTATAYHQKIMLEISSPMETEDASIYWHVFHLIDKETKTWGASVPFSFHVI